MNRTLIPSLFLTLGLLLIVGVRSYAAIYYVSPNGSDSNSGKTWTTAKQTVQAAINLAVSGDQVWVKHGTYTVSSGSIITLGSAVARRSIANNIVAFGSSGIGVNGSVLPTLTTNCVYGSTLDNYDGLPPKACDIGVYIPTKVGR